MAGICERCLIGIQDMILLCEDDARVKEFLLYHNLISNSRKCVTCDREVLLNWTSKKYRCQRNYIRNKKKVKCNFNQSIFKNTYFDKTHLKPTDILKMTVYSLHLTPPRQTLFRSEFGFSSKTIVDWMSFYREVCIHFADSKHELLGGENEIIEVDEAKVGKRKYNRGRRVEGQWVFGGVLRSDKRKCFLVPVQDRTKETLLKAIQDNILPGTTIYSDCWKAYNCLETEGFRHLTVNHSMNFVDPATKAHTQNIERLWRDVRANVPRYGRSIRHYQGYLAEFVFKRHFPDLKERAHYFFQQAAKLYPPV